MRTQNPEKAMHEDDIKTATDDAWQRVFRALDGAQETSTGRQEAVIREALSDSPEALALAESLGKIGGPATGFLEHDPAAALPQEAEGDGPDPMLGARLGVYEVVEPIAAGGMGSVYRARRADGLYEQTVAVKVLLGDLGSPEARERFRIERRLLARLEHPSIARILDGGVTDDGRPYFVMEHVDGVRLDRAYERLNLDERLALFERIADAVRYAHAHMVVHRDLKPANVLVTREGEPKLLDFGIAKLISDSETAPTITAERPLTPQYAAPEQIRGDEVTQSSDIYGLGLLLYELITGSRPYRVTGTRAEAARIVCETDPTPPSRAAADDTGASKWAARLRGDLDRIVQKAIRKEPGERYSSAERLIEDVRRFREHRPILARPASPRYALAMFVRRHPVASVTGAAACIVLIGGVLAIGAAYQRVSSAVRAEQEQRLIAEQVGLFLDDMLSSIDPANARGRDTELLTEVLERAHDRLRDGAVGAEAARAPLEFRVGSVYAAIGSTERAEDHLAAAESLWEELGKGDSPEMADTLFTRAVLEINRGGFEEAERRLTRAIEIRQRELGAGHHKVGQALDARGGVMLTQGRLVEAAPDLEAAAEILAEHFETGSDDLLHNVNKRAIIAAQSGDLASARDLVRPHTEAALDRSDPTPAVTSVLNTMAVLCSRAGDHDEANRWYRRATEIAERIYGPTHQHTLTARMNAAVARQRGGDVDEAEAEYRAILAAQRGALGADHPDTLSTTLNLAVLIARSDEPAESIPMLRGLLDDTLRVRGPGHPTTAITRAALGEAILQAGPEHETEAIDLLTRALEDLERTIGPDSGPVQRVRRVLDGVRDLNELDSP